MAEKEILIPGRLKSAAVGGYVTGARDIVDDVKGKNQQAINGETDGSLSNLNSRVVSEEAARVSSDNLLQNQIDAGIRSGEGLVFDTEPKKESANPVLSGGLWNELYKDRTKGKELRLTSGMNKNKLMRSGGTYTSTTNAYTMVSVLPCAKGELFKVIYAASEDGVSNSRSFAITYTSTIPAVGVDFTSIYAVTVADTNEHEVVFSAPDNGYIALAYRVQDTNNNFSKVQIWKWYDINITNDYLYKGSISVSYPSSNKRKYLDADTESQTFGSMVSLSNANDNYIVSNLIDVEGLSYIKIYNIHTTAAGLYADQAGSIFYDSESQPISVACYMQYSVGFNYDSIIVKVPDNAKYLRISGGRFNNSTYSDLQSSIEAWSNEKLNTKLVVDDTPTENSNNLIKSGGVFNVVNTLNSEMSALNNEMFDIQVSSLTSQFTPMIMMTRVKITDDDFTIASTNSTYHLIGYYACTTGEKLQLAFTPTSSSAVVRLCFSTQKPAIGVTLSLIKRFSSYNEINVSQTYNFQAPADGYIAVHYYNYEGSYFGGVGLYEFIDADSIVYGHENMGLLKSTWTKNKLIIADDTSEDFGNVVDATTGSTSHNECVVSDFIDIEGTTYLRLGNIRRKFIYTAEAIFGSVFYDSEQSPISAANYIQYGKNGVWLCLTQVPEGAKYIRISVNNNDTSKTVEAFGEEQEAPSVVDSVTTIQKKLAVRDEFTGESSGATLRNGTPADNSETDRVCNKYVQAANSCVVIFCTDRPNTEGCVYRWGYRTYSTSSGLTYVNANLSAKIRTTNASWGNTTNFIVMQPGENGYAVEIAEYDATTGVRQTLRTTDFEGYKLYTLTFDINSHQLADEQRRDILALNPYPEMIQKIYSARKSYASSASDQTQPVVIAHLSDTHGGWESISRFIEFTERYAVDARVLTGDIVRASLTDDNINGLQAIDRIGKVMMVIGNHDTSHYYQASGETEKHHHWRDYINLPAYNAFIAPHVADWGVTQPEGAAENGYCYYYKDFADKNLRLICVDIMAYDTTQDTWLRGLLTEALTAGPLDEHNNPTSRHVLIATHFAGCRMPAERYQTSFSVVDCSYSTNALSSPDSDDFCTYSPEGYKMTDTVDNFIDAGGKFAGYIAGHFHRDYVAKVYNARNVQMIYGVDLNNGQNNVGHDFSHQAGTQMFDSFQLVSVTTVINTVKLYKIGAQIDRYAKRHEMVAINYVTGKIVSEPYDVEKRLTDYESRISALEERLAQLNV